MRACVCVKVSMHFRECICVGWCFESEGNGIRPDNTINPHAFPSRTTIGMQLESMAAMVRRCECVGEGLCVEVRQSITCNGQPALPLPFLFVRQNGALHGYCVNASTFRSADPCPKPLILHPHRKPSRPASARKQKHLSSSTKQLLREHGAGGVAVRARAGERNKSMLAGMEPGQEGEDVVDLFGRELVAKGYNYYGTERMYSGIYGTEMECEIYIGVVYYQRLRHMVSDKFQVGHRMKPLRRLKNDARVDV